MIRKLLALFLIILSAAMLTSLKPATASQTSYDINTLAGKLASVNNTPGLLISLSDFLQQEADMSDQNANPTPNDPITPVHVLNSTLDGTTVQSPNTVALSKGTFDSSGNLHCGLPTFVGQTNAA